MLLTDIDRYKKELKVLWHDVFSDDEEYIELIFDSIGESVRIFAHSEDRKIVSALYAIPSLIILSGKRFSGLYVYACATFKNYRSRGFLSGLMNECAEYAAGEQLSFLSLVPGGKSLYAYYESFGFEKAMHRFSGRHILSSGVYDTRTIREISFDEYFTLRPAFLSDHFCFREKEEAYLEACLRFGDYKYYKGNGFAFVFDKEDGEISELCAADDASFEGALERACCLLDLKEVVYYSPNGGEKNDFGMVLPLDESFRAEDHNNIYMNFALD